RPAVLVVEHAHAGPVAARRLLQLAVVFDAALLREEPPSVARDHEPRGHVMVGEHLEQAHTVDGPGGAGDRENDGKLRHRPRLLGVGLRFGCREGPGGAGEWGVGSGEWYLADPSGATVHTV